MEPLSVELVSRLGTVEIAAGKRPAVELSSVELPDLLATVEVIIVRSRLLCPDL